MKSVFLIFLLLFSLSAQAQITLKSARAPDLFTLSYPKSTPTATFFNEYGQDVGISNFRGKIILLNIWSTGCPQCVIELPMLDRLQKEMGGMKFQVIALSSGLENIPTLRRFSYPAASEICVFIPTRRRSIRRRRAFWDCRRLF